MTAKSSYQGPFVTGFATGLAAGAAGVYFLATNKGKGFIKEMNELWEEAKPALVKEGVIKASDQTLTEALKSFLIETLAEEAGEVQITTKKRIRKQKMLFKGV